MATVARERTVLCFGDSNTWGYQPGSRERHGGERYQHVVRHPRDVRWPGVLQKDLGDAWHVVEAGLNGRTSVFEDQLGDKCGLRHIGPVLESAAPIDLVIVMLGTNDLKTRHGASAYEIAEGAARVADVARSSPYGPGGVAPAVLLVAPAPIASLTGWAERDPEAFEGFETMYRGSLETSREFAKQYARVARVRGMGFLDAGSHLQTSDVDGVHWSSEAHGAFGRAVAKAMRDNFDF